MNQKWSNKRQDWDHRNTSWFWTIMIVQMNAICVWNSKKVCMTSRDFLNSTGNLTVGLSENSVIYILFIQLINIFTISGYSIDVNINRLEAVSDSSKITWKIKEYFIYVKSEFSQFSVSRVFVLIEIFYTSPSKVMLSTLYGEWSWQSLYFSRILC